MRDFSERLTLKFNKEVQAEHFLGGATVSIEGVATEFWKENEGGELVKNMEFHTYISDGKQQDSAIVHFIMEKLIRYLQDKGILKVDCTLYCHSDGCSGQYRSSTAY